ncbi:MAG: MinD/ParA family protein [Thermodesulfobacteriota bacterium]
MGKIISVHSFRGGTGKSNISANLAVCMAMRGLRVGVVDTDIQSPGINVLFKVDAQKAEHTLNDYLYGTCSIEQAAVDVGSELHTEDGKPAITEGALFLVPSSGKLTEIAKILRQGYDTKLLNKGFKSLFESLNLDVLFLDTHPGLNEETLLSMAMSHTVVLVLRPDRQDFTGTAVTVEVARKLDVPNLYLLANKVLSNMDMDDLRSKLTQAYKVPVIGLLPLSVSVAETASSGIFVLKQPGHTVSRILDEIADKLLER